MSLDTNNINDIPDTKANKRGRPKKTSNEVQNIKDTILQAIRVVFGQSGSPGLTVAKVIAQANISRPTFYKYFKNVEEPLNIIIKTANLKLVNCIEVDAKNTSELIPLILLIIDNYLSWGVKEIDIMRSIRQELLAPTSIVAAHRQNTIESLHQIVKKTLNNNNKIFPDKIIFETLIMAGENIGYHMLISPDINNLMKYRRDLIKMAIALFGDDKDWEDALTQHDLFKL